MIYETLRVRIQNKDFTLNEILGTIDMFYASGKLTLEQHTELTSMARENADPIVESGINEKLLELASQIHDLEQRVSSLEAGSAGNDSTEEPEIKPFEEGHWYYNGDKILWNGEAYICVAPEGQVCVWSPDAHPAYWQKLLA